MITIAHGNLLKADAEALVNTVNTQGVMGKGIALQFKRAFPQVFKRYFADSKDGLVQLGKMHIVDLGSMGGGPRWVINFPTKDHWRAKSRLEDIQAGLEDLVAVIEKLGIRSIAMPPLGCGNGGLSWNDVLPLIEATMSNLPHTQVLVYPPERAPDAEDMPVRTATPKMTLGSAVVIALISQYQRGLLDPFVRLLEVHKLMYFLQEAGEPLSLKYTADKYGPYATNLRHVLSRIEGHWISGFGDGHDNPHKPIEIISDAAQEALSFLEDRFDTAARMERVAHLINGFEDAYGLELLSTVHWALMHEEGASQSLDAVIDYINKWSTRKAATMKPEHIEIAWTRLKDHHWDSEARSAKH